MDSWAEIWNTVGSRCLVTSHHNYFASGAIIKEEQSAQKAVISDEITLREWCFSWFSHVYWSIVRIEGLFQKDRFKVAHFLDANTLDNSPLPLPLGTMPIGNTCSNSQWSRRLNIPLSTWSAFELRDRYFRKWKSLHKMISSQMLKLKIQIDTVTKAATCFEVNSKANSSSLENTSNTSPSPDRIRIALKSARSSRVSTIFLAWSTPSEITFILQHYSSSITAFVCLFEQNSPVIISS